MGRSVVEAFIKKTVQAESSCMAGGAFLTDKTPGAVAGERVPGHVQFKHNYLFVDKSQIIRAVTLLDFSFLTFRSVTL